MLLILADLAADSHRDEVAIGFFSQVIVMLCKRASAASHADAFVFAEPALPAQVRIIAKLRENL